MYKKKRQKKRQKKKKKIGARRARHKPDAAFVVCF